MIAPVETAPTAGSELPDGSELTASDVVFTFNRYAHIGLRQCG